MRKKKAYRITKKIFIGTVALFATVAIISIGIFTYFVYNFKDPDLDAAFQNLNLDYSTIIYANDPETKQPVEIEHLFKDENRIWVNRDKIPQYMKDAVVCIEDKRYYQHNGVDWIRTSGAMLNYVLKFKGNYGGSTLTQQLIKNITGDDAVSVNRKVTEIFRALYIERKYNKEEILEYYMNTVVFGATRLYGVQTASKYYFNKDVSNLSVAEAACIVGITNNPSLYDPFLKPEGNKQRTKNILNEMYKMNKLSKEEYDNALAEADNLSFNTENKNSDKPSKQSYFVDQLINDVSQDLMKEKGYTEDYAINLIYTKGLKIYSTMDPIIQKDMDAIFKDDINFPKTKGTDVPQSAMVIMDFTNGNVVGLIGGRGEKTTDRGLNRATQTYRQPGSAIKPIAVYAPAIEYKVVSPGQSVDDAPINPEGNWPANFTRNYTGYTTIRTAIEQSINAAAAQIIQKMGPDRSFEFLTSRLHITSLVKSQKIGGKVYTDITNSLSLGGLTKGLSVLELTAAYQIFPNHGIYNPTRTYTKVETYDGKVLLDNTDVNSNVAISAQTAYEVHQFLYSNTLHGTAWSGKLANVPSGGKTGTTTDDKDRWYVGYTPNYVGCVWFGYDQPKTITITTANPSAKLFQTTMNKINTDKKLSGGDFEIPGGVVEVQVCKDSGLLPSPACYLDPRGSRIDTVWMNTENVPTQPCNIHHIVYICGESGCIANQNCPKATLRKVALLDYTRSYTNSNVYVGDAQYLCPIIPSSVPLFVDPVWPAYMNMLSPGYYPARSSAARPMNTVCTLHTPPNPAYIVTDSTLISSKVSSSSSSPSSVSSSSSKSSSPKSSSSG